MDTSPINVEEIRLFLQQLDALGVDTLYLPEGILDSTVFLSKKEQLANLEQSLVNCMDCKLCKKRTQVVFGAGNPEADLVFVGEAPGADEDRQGKPFVGRAGQLLTRMIEAMGLTRDDVFICNVIKCRPPDNRNPEIDEIASCEPFLKEQLAIIQPKAIAALGKFAAQTLLKSSTGITRLRGQWHEYNGIKLMPTFHPSYFLHIRDKQREKEEKQKAWDDLQKVMEELGLK